MPKDSITRPRPPRPLLKSVKDEVRTGLLRQMGEALAPVTEAGHEINVSAGWTGADDVRAMVPVDDRVLTDDLLPWVSWMHSLEMLDSLLNPVWQRLEDLTRPDVAFAPTFDPTPWRPL